MGTGSKCEMWLNSEWQRINSFALRVNVNAEPCQSKVGWLFLLMWIGILAFR